MKMFDFTEIYNNFNEDESQEVIKEIEDEVLKVILKHINNQSNTPNFIEIEKNGKIVRATINNGEVELSVNLKKT